MQLDREISGAAYEMDVERQALDGIAPQRPDRQQPNNVIELVIERRGLVIERDFGLEL